MRISIGIEKYNSSHGGAEKYCWDLSHYLAGKGHQINIICLKGTQPSHPNIRIHRVYPIKFPQFLRHAMYSLLHFSKVRQLQDDVSIGLGNTFYMDLYQPHGGLHCAWAEKEILKYPKSVRKLMRLVRRIDPKNAVQRILEIWSFRITKPEIIAISAMVKNDIMNWFGYPEDHIHLVPNGIDTQRFSRKNISYRSEIREKYGLADDDFVFIFVATNLRLKGYSTLLDACAKLKDLPFKILVAGPKSPWFVLKTILMGLRHTFVFAGKINGLEHVYPACNCLVHPTFYDACSLVVLEALSSGLPVITTSSNGASMYITNENGYVIAPGDPQSLAQAMQKEYQEPLKDIKALTFEDDHAVFNHIEQIILGYVEKRNKQGKLYS